MATEEGRGGKDSGGREKSRGGKKSRGGRKSTGGTNSREGKGSGDGKGSGAKPEGSNTGSDRPERRELTAGESVWEWTKSILIALVLFLVIRTFLVQTFVITSGSMRDTLLVGDFLMVNRLALGSRIPGTSIRTPGYSEPRRGDVTVFDPPHEEDLKLVKRLVGMPGDTVSMRDKVLHINGVPQKEPYARYDDADGTTDATDPWMAWQREYLVDTVSVEDYRPTRDDWGPIVVPADHFFMLGDNRDASLDSRYWGLLERWRLEGKAFFIYFSYDRDALVPFPFIQEVRWGRIFDGIERRPPADQASSLGETGVDGPAS
ncbi:MAG: signal peptidase I [Longimicrobiales bacterium]